MLEGLSAVRWDHLKHAYGDASDVPDLLLGLVSRNSGKRQESLQTLFQTIWHQGTVYSASSAAVPFLCELLRSKTVKDKAEILGLLQAIGSAYPQQNETVDLLWREKRSSLEMKGYLANAKWARRARKAVAAEISTYLLLLNDSLPTVRATAAFTLAGRGKRSPEIQSQLRHAIETETHSGVKAAFIFAWYRLFRAVKQDAPVIRSELRRLARSTHEKPIVRLVAAIGLSPLFREKAKTKWVRFLSRAYKRSSQDLHFLSQCSGTFSPIEQLSSTLRYELCLEFARKPNQSTREVLGAYLEFLCREDRRYFAKVIPLFGQLLSDDDSEFRERIALGLSQMGTWNRYARVALVAALQDSNPKVALWSVVALSKLRDPSVLQFILDKLAPELHVDAQKPAVPLSASPLEMFQLQLAAGKQSLSLRLLLDALRPFGRDGQDALPHLRVLLMNRGADIQKLVCPALAAIGEPASDTVPIVARLLKVREVQTASAGALLRWGSVATGAIPEILDFLEGVPDADQWAKQAVIEALGLMGAEARTALPVLSRLLSDPDYRIKCAAALAIWRIAPGSQDVIRTLVDELRAKTQPGWAIHGGVEVIKTLESLGHFAKSASPILEKLLDDSDGWARVHSARALWRIGTDLHLILPVLADDLLCRPLGILTGVLAAECLAEIGPRAAVAIPRLKEILAREACFASYGTCWAESDEAYRSALLKALTAIEGGEHQQLVSPGRD